MYSNEIVELWNTSNIIFCIIILSVIRYWNGNGMTFCTIMKRHGGLRYRYSLLRSGDFNCFRACAPQQIKNE